MAYPLVLLHTPNPSDESAQKKGKHWILRVKLLFRALILVVVITGIVIGSQVSSAIDDPQGGAVDTIKTLKKVNYVVSLVLVVLVAAGTLLTFVRYPAAVPTKKLAHVLGTCAPLLVVSAYKVVSFPPLLCFSWTGCLLSLFHVRLTGAERGLQSIFLDPLDGRLLDSRVSFLSRLILTSISIFI